MLNSILNQTFNEHEVIIIDDNSKENINDILNSYKQLGLNIRYYKNNERNYTLMSRITGIKKARGEVILFADADDRLLDNTSLEKNIELYNKEKSDVVHFKMAIIDKDGHIKKILDEANPLTTKCYNDEYIKLFFSSDISCISLCNKIISAKLLKNINNNLYDVRFNKHYDDLWIYLNIIDKINTYVGSNIVGYGYYFIDKYHQGIPDRAISFFKCCDEIEKKLISLNIPKDVIIKFNKYKSIYNCIYMGKFCKFLYTCTKNERNKYLDILLKRNDLRDIITSIILSNGMNANKIIDIFNIINAR